MFLRVNKKKLFQKFISFLPELVIHEYVVSYAGGSSLLLEAKIAQLSGEGLLRNAYILIAPLSAEGKKLAIQLSR